MIMGEESLRGCTGFISEVKGDCLLVAIRKQEALAADSELHGAKRGEQRLRQLIAHVFELEYGSLAGGYRKGDRQAAGENALESGGRNLLRRRPECVPCAC